MPAVMIPAPAKLNLALSVGPADPAAGGLHPIATWMVTIDLADELNLLRLPEGTLSRYAILWHHDARQRSEINWPITSDLAVRAHRLLEQHTRRSLPVQMRLEKRIPVGGGLGGGSSDAAAMLRGINALFELELDEPVLEQLAGELGSDVPFFLRSGSAVVSGFGETIRRHPNVPKLHAVLAMPEAMCPTGAVYRAFDQLGKADLQHAAVESLAGDGAQAPRPEQLFNDLTVPAINVTSALREHLQVLGQLAERPAGLSGSGSSLFVLCDDQMHAQALAEHVERQMKIAAMAVCTYQESHDLVIST